TTADSILLAQKSMDALWLRQQAISGNIANHDTPGYKSKAVLFESLLEDALGAAGRGRDMQERLGSVSPRIEEARGLAVGEDGNSVDADAENIALVQAQFQYQAMAQAVSGEFSRMSYVLNGGK
ncbi:MAG TPA: flagellar basal body rod protein FlgB, partial [Terriglobales bacterium]|nr:flagellar basal body rod protein FlgB [Terriglobales bacterium]